MLNEVLRLCYRMSADLSSPISERPALYRSLCRRSKADLRKPPPGRVHCHDILKDIV
jgi:hypothetical protein